jgi:EF-P beta-lysylation protein EpmB
VAVAEPHCAPGAAATWQAELRRAFRRSRDLAEFLELPSAGSRWAEEDFPCLVPQPFAQRMAKGNPRDPLLLQVLPRGAERERPAGFSADPLAEHNASPGAGLLHKYPGRVLLVTTGACPVHCRYCFRRHFPYQSLQAGQQDWRAAARHIAASGQIKEVILSGGDPLTLSNRRIRALIAALADIPHLATIRIHTRFPVILPQRVDAGLLAALRAARQRIVVVLHVNHPNEIDGSVCDALGALRAAGMTLLNQAVLLRAVNDAAPTLAALSERLFAAGVLPYYLHLLDPVAGAAHFEVSATRGQALVRALREHLPGYLVPRLVREIPGELSKTPLG